MEPLEQVPKVNGTEWKKAQALVKRGWQKVGFRMKHNGTTRYVFPSTELLKDHLPEGVTKASDIITHLQTWAKEFILMFKRQRTYEKLFDGSWDFKLLCEMLNSFWILTPIPDEHPKAALLREVGIAYTCTCEPFLHYHVCKHCLAFGLSEGDVELPMRFSTAHVGKRKAPAGARSNKRSHCLSIDD